MCSSPGSVLGTTAHGTTVEEHREESTGEVYAVRAIESDDERVNSTSRLDNTTARRFRRDPHSRTQLARPRKVELRVCLRDDGMPRRLQPLPVGILSANARPAGGDALAKDRSGHQTAHGAGVCRVQDRTEIASVLFTLAMHSGVAGGHPNVAG